MFHIVLLTLQVLADANSNADSLGQCVGFLFMVVGVPLIAVYFIRKRKKG